MITQMYFPGDPLFALDPIYQSITDPKARDRLVATYDHDVTQHEWATGYRWDIVLTGSREPRWREEQARDELADRDPRPDDRARSSATRCRSTGDNELVPPGIARRRPAARRRCTTATVQRCPTRCSRSGRPTPNGAVVQPAGSLRRDGWTFTGWGRAGTDGDGHYSLHHRLTRCRRRTGPAPFFAVTVFARGLLNRLFTRAYLPGEPLASEPLLASLPNERRDTLVARGRRARLRFDIRLQGDGETVFLRFPGHRQ